MHVPCNTTLVVIEPEMHQGEIEISKKIGSQFYDACEDDVELISIGEITQRSLPRRQ